MRSLFNVFRVRLAQASGAEIPDDVFGERLWALYKPLEAKEVIDQLKKCRKSGANKMARELKSRYTYRIGNISEFMKSLKQKFKRWYNLEQGESMNGDDLGARSKVTA